MEEGKWSVKLDLMVGIYNASTGNAIEESNLSFTKNGKPLLALNRGGGEYIFLNAGRENGLMQISVYGYEPVDVFIDYELLDERMPLLDVFLIPSENHRAGDGVIFFKGKLSGLKKLEALHPGRPVTGIKDFDAKKMTMSVFSPNRRVSLTRRYYGLLHDDRESYEDIIVLDETSGDSVKLKEPIREGFSPNSPICPIIFGQVKDDGSFVLAVKDDGENLNYLVKFQTEDKTEYRKIDFHHLDEVTLDKEK